MLLLLQAILLVTGFIGALGQIKQIPDTPSITIGGFSESYMVTVDEEDGRVYVSDWLANVVRVFNENGGLALTITAGLSNPGGIAISTDGHLYIADQGNSRIVVTTKDGSLLSTVGTYGSGEGQFIYPFDVAIGPDGLLYVADLYNSRVQVLTLDGEFAKKIDLQGYPSGVVFGTDGRLHVCFYDSSKIVVFDTDGAEVQSVDLGYSIIHVDIDSCGYVFVTGDEDHVNIYDEYYNLRRTISSSTSKRFIGIARWEGKNEIWATDFGENAYVFSGP